MKIFKFFIFILFLSHVHADKLQISEVVIFENSDKYSSNMIVFLNDNSIWEIINPESRWRTLKEWWNNKQLIDVSFKWEKNNWRKNDVVSLISEVNQRSYIDIDNLSYSQKEDFRRFNCIISNINCDKNAFARPITIEMAIARVNHYLQEIKDQGYENGYNKGKIIGYDQGYLAGYNRGYAKRIEEENNPNPN